MTQNIKLPVHASPADLSALGLYSHSLSTTSVGLVLFCAVDDYPPDFSCIGQKPNDHPPYTRSG